MLEFSIRLAAIVMRWTVRAVAAALLLLTLAWAALHWVIVPRIDEWRPWLQNKASEAIAAPVTIGAIRAESNALVPTVALLDVRVNDPSGHAGLRVPRVLAAFSVLSLSTGGLEQLVIEQPELEVRRTAQGRLLVGGIELPSGATDDTRAADWFFSQREFVVRGGSVTWIDEQRAAPPVALNDVQLVVRGGHRRHQIRLDATPQDGWGQRLTLIGQFRQPVLSLRAGQWRGWSGQIYADLPHVDVSRLRQYADLKAEWGVDLRQGQGALRAWVNVRRGAVVSVTADLALGAVSARFGSGLEPLAFGSVSGRLGWRNRAGAIDFDTRGLRFVDADGLVWPGGNFAFRYSDGQGGQAAGGELRGDTLDLAALVKIASRLPLPPAAHERLQAHPLRGLVDNITARWDGPLEAPRGWSLKTRLSALAVGASAAPPRADGKPAQGVPGIEGAALELEATGAGGHATLGIEGGALEFPGVFEEPRIPLAELSMQTRWRVQGERIEVEVEELKLRNQDATGSFKARWHTADVKQPDESRFPGVLDLEGSFSRADGARVYRYLPLAVGAPARRYVRDAIQKGEARDVAVRIKGNLLDIPFDKHPAAGPPQGGVAPSGGSAPREAGERGGIDPSGGEFRFAGQVRGVTMAYVPRSIQPEGQTPWPALEDLAGELVFEGGSMRVRNASARVQGYPGWQFPRVQADIADLAHTRVTVDADGRGALAAALGIVRQSPVAQFTQHALDRASASGDAALKLKLDLPVMQIHDAKVEGSVGLQGNNLRISPESPPLAQARGTVGFSDTGFAVQDVRARTLGGDALINGGMQPAGADGLAPVLLRVSGAASADGLRQMREWAVLSDLAGAASGSAAYEASIGFHAGAPEVTVTSDLRGMAFDLPAPLAKSADAAWPLRYESRPQAASAVSAARERVRLTVADQLALEYELDTSAASARVLRGVIGIGPQAMPNLALPASGVLARLQLPRLSVDAWAHQAGVLLAGDMPADSRGYLPSAWSVHVGQLLVDERALHDVASSGTRDGATWRADVQARELAGRVEYSEGADGRAGAVHARLKRLSIPVSSADDEQAAELADPPVHIPALDIVADEFELRGKKLGRLEVEAVNHDVALVRGPAAGLAQGGAAPSGDSAPREAGERGGIGPTAGPSQGGAAPSGGSAPREAGERGGNISPTVDVQEWQLTRLLLDTPEASLSASGLWAARARALPPDSRPPGHARRTELDFKLDIHDGGALLARLGMPGTLAHGKGLLEGSIGWAGSPLSPHYPSMSGQLHLDVGAGQFLKADPGVAKLLGVLSMQALPRRLTLDFRDVFSAGFAFDFVRGDVAVKSGVAATRNLQMKGVNAAVLMEGSADIDQETQDLRVLVVPEIDASTAALAAAVINPAVGIGAFVAQLVLKRPLIKAATREFHISGRWDDPQVTQVDRSAGKAAQEPGNEAADAAAKEEK
ncbi:MAG: hypothetical protein FWG56_11320 [Desulfovibrionaceae bacterium]|nr:hypothetical protein [Desulfovibrionaceae bacterium]